MTTTFPSRLPALAALVLFALFPAACTSPQPAPKPGVPEKVIRTRNQALSLFYDLVSSDQDVGKVFLLKQVDPAVGRLVKEIAKACADARTALDAFAKADPSLRLDVTGLPPMEKKTRDLDSSATTRELLFASGRDFDLRLLLTQVDALGYAGRLAATAREVDEDANRREALGKWARQFLDLREKVIGMLSVLPTGPTTAPAGR
jgi:hypothetical protein